jgi:lysophospholipase L1-like esterase
MKWARTCIHRKCGRLKQYVSWRGASRLLLSLLLTGAVVPVVFLGTSSQAGAATPLTGFYLDLGASASVGYQPTDTAPHGERTTDGYANDIVTYEAQRGMILDLTELGCPDETTATMISGDDGCYHDDGSQLLDALAFLRAHASDAGIVTIDLGFNDLRHCVIFGSFSKSCVNTSMTEIDEQLPYILKVLQWAAGPGVSFVGVDHYNPYLAEAISGATGARIATSSEPVMKNLNIALSSMFAGAGIPMATVSASFDNQSHVRVDVVGLGTIPDNVAQICELTWMCAPKPFGPNVHPNDEGYLTIASAIESQLTAPWSDSSPTLST